LYVSNVTLTRVSIRPEGLLYETERNLLATANSFVYKVTAKNDVHIFGYSVAGSLLDRLSV